MADQRQRLPALRVPEWETIPHLVHGFLGRSGGASRGPFAELNLSYRVGDATETVHENWRRVSDETGGVPRSHVQQVHGDRVVTVDNAGVDGGEADAIVTGATAVAVGVLTADCVPILLVAPRNHVVAAVHAGWRGTLAGVAQRAVQHVADALGAPVTELRVALGPSIGGCCYEVDRQVADALEQRWGPMPDAVRKHTGAKAMIDLRRANAAILEQSGVRRTQMVTIGPCTRCANTEYFSHRAANGPTGRQWSFVAWRA